MSRLSEHLTWNPYRFFEPHTPPSQIHREPPPVTPLTTLPIRQTVHAPSMRCLPSSYAHPVKRPGHGSKYVPSSVSQPDVVLARAPQGFLLAVMVGRVGRRGV